MVNVTVLGSINMDVVTNVEKHPVTGETVKGWGTDYCPGGKGANQAVAVHFAGGNVTMIGAVGNDPFSKKLLENFEDVGLQTNYIIQKETNSGLAFITVNSSGDNNIILSEGANAKLSIDDVKRLQSIINSTDILLLQNEIPWETSSYAIDQAHERGIKIILNPAPAGNVDKSILSKIDLLVLNESEAKSLTGIGVHNYSQAKEAITKLLNYGIMEVILTLGVNGALYSNKDEIFLYTPSFKVRVEDTTAAGDTFIGAFATEISTNKPIKESLEFATAAAAITVTKKGAQLSIPRREEIEQFLQSKYETYENITIKGECENEFSKN
jgi:ribokinase